MKAIIGTFPNLESANQELSNLQSTCMILNFDFNTDYDVVKLTVIVCTEFEATEYVLNQMSLTKLKAIAKAYGQKLTKPGYIKVPRTREDIEAAIANEEITATFIKWNLDNLFRKGNEKFRKMNFEEKGIAYHKQVWTKNKIMNKQQLIQSLLENCSDVYTQYSTDIYFYVK